jgi:hypothetical protein
MKKIAQHFSILYNLVSEKSKVDLKNVMMSAVIEQYIF